jgi:hypothetical protein
MKSIIISSLFVCLLFCSCGMIQDCRENEKTFKKSFLYEKQIPLTVEEFKTLICSDTTHYKMVFFYSPCCYSGNDLLQVIRKFDHERDSNKVKLYFVASGTGDTKYNEKFLSDHGFSPEKMYFLRDTTNKFVRSWGKYNIDFSVAWNYVFSTQTDSLTCLGTPETLIISKSNQLKRWRVKSTDKRGIVHYKIAAYFLEELKSFDFDKINFDLVE